MIKKLNNVGKFFYENHKTLLVDAMLTAGVIMIFVVNPINPWILGLMIFTLILGTGMRSWSKGASHAFQDFDDKIQAMESLQENVFLNSVFSAAMDKYRVRNNSSSDIQ